MTEAGVSPAEGRAVSDDMRERIAEIIRTEWHYNEARGEAVTLLELAIRCTER